MQQSILFFGICWNVRVWLSLYHFPLYRSSFSLYPAKFPFAYIIHTDAKLIPALPAREFRNDCINIQVGCCLETGKSNNPTKFQHHHGFACTKLKCTIISVLYALIYIYLDVGGKLYANQFLCCTLFCYAYFTYKVATNEVTMEITTTYALAILHFTWTNSLFFHSDGN